MLDKIEKLRFWLKSSRKIDFRCCSKERIESIVPENNSILISIAGVNDQFAQIDNQNYKDVLRLRFSDVTRDVGKFIPKKENLGL